MRTVPSLIELGGGSGTQDDLGLLRRADRRGNLTGLVVMESAVAAAYSERDADMLRGFLEPAALAIDNARWFARLRTVGADEERTRIARDLHDRIGQSLAYLAFELDRIVKTYEQRRATSAPSLDRSATTSGASSREVRDTLYDLRTDVSEEQDFAADHRGVPRAGARSAANLRARGRARRPPGGCRCCQERELWRIAQEAVTNVERHAKASSVSVTWRTDGRRPSSSRSSTTASGSRAARPVASTPTGSSACASGRRASGRPSRSSAAEGRGTVVRCRLDAA